MFLLTEGEQVLRIFIVVIQSLGTDHFRIDQRCALLLTDTAEGAVSDTGQRCQQKGIVQGHSSQRELLMYLFVHVC